MTLYIFAGGMQDYNYIAHGCMEITLEISCCKYPPPDELPTFWIDNKLVHNGTVKMKFWNLYYFQL